MGAMVTKVASTVGYEGSYSSDRLIWDTPPYRYLKSSIQHIFRRLEGRQLMTHIGICMGAMVTKVASTVGYEGSYSIRSENELRYAIGDPIMDMLVQCWGYQVTNCIVKFAKATVQFPNRLGLRSKWTRRIRPPWNRLIPVRAQGERQET